MKPRTPNGAQGQRARPRGHLWVVLAICLGANALAAASAPRVEHVVPFYQFTQTLVASEDMEVRKYLAFPITLRLAGSANSEHLKLYLLPR